MQTNKIVLFISTLILLFSTLNVHAQEITHKQNTKESQSFKGKAVLVTGASSGIGRKIAEALAAKGVFVYAGARKQQDIKQLSALNNIQGVRLDVTKPEEISAAVDLVAKQGRGLYGLVNNAGVFVHAPMIEVSEADLQFLFDVNVLGPYRITKAFAPLIIESKGRIATTGSISGVVSGSMFGPYSMTKHATEAYHDALQAEMKKFEVGVSLIEPGNFKSDIMKNMQRRNASRKAEMQKSGATTLYEQEYQAMLNFTKEDRSIHKEPDAVADAVIDALFSDTPKSRYMVVPRQAEADFAIGALIKKLVQMNAGHEYSRSAEELRDRLTQAMN